MAMEENMADGEVIAAAKRISAAGGTVRAVIETLDIETGETGLRILRMPSDGSGEAEAAEDDAEDKAAAAIAAKAPLGLRAVLSAGKSLWALEGPPDSAEGEDQRLHVRHGRKIETVDLSALGLSVRRAITSLGLLGDRLVVFVADAVTGFEAWSRPADAGAGEFEQMIGEGAQRFALNAAVPAALALEEGLLAGTAALAAGAASVGNWGPELLLLRADGDWEPVIGPARFSAQGLKRPLTGQTAGFGRPGNAAIQAIASGEVEGGRQIAVAVQEFAGDPVEDRRDLAPDLLDYMGAVRLYVSSDLLEWHEIEVDLPETAGAVTALAVTEAGFVLGHEGIGADAVPLTVVPRQ